jgi:hypothetical protein
LLHNGALYTTFWKHPMYLRKDQTLRTQAAAGATFVNYICYKKLLNNFGG